MGDALPERVFNAAGLLGVIFYLGSYAALQAGRIKGNDYTYATLNLIAAALVLASMVVKFNLWSAMIQTSWIVISIVGLSRHYILTRRIRFSPQEQSLLTTWLRDLPLLDARQLISAGTWTDSPPGTALTTEGQVIGRHYLVTSGQAEVQANDRSIGHLQAPCAIGEITCFDGGPAIATVTATETVRAFTLDTVTLDRICQRNGKLRFHLDISLARDTHAKLIAVNGALAAT